LSGAGLSLPSLLLLQLASQAALRVTTLGEIIHYFTFNLNNSYKLNKEFSLIGTKPEFMPFKAFFLKNHIKNF